MYKENENSYVEIRMTTSSPAREVSFQTSGPRCHWTIHIVILIQLLFEAYL